MFRIRAYRGSRRTLSVFRANQLHRQAQFHEVRSNSDRDPEGRQI